MIYKIFKDIKNFHPQQLVISPRELGIHRRTVKRYFDIDSQKDSKCTNSITGSVKDIDPKPVVDIAILTGGRRSECESYRSFIIDGLERGLTGRRIHQDLVEEHQFKASYQSVQRFIHKLEVSNLLPFRRLECEPGEEVQVDFGSAAPVIDSNGKRRRPHLLRVILSHSRKGYSEVVPRQSTEFFIRALENSFRHFGGVPRKVIIDNLRAAVSKADFYDPDINPKIRSFCQHYQTVVLPTKPWTPRHKGKVERGVGYVKDNALKGRSFPSISAQNQFLSTWEKTVADTRIHGTTRRQVKAAFALERDHLQKLPDTLFPYFEECRRTVHRDQHVEVKCAYYSVPSEYVRREVWVRYTTRTVKIFNQHWKVLANHVRVESGQRSTDFTHIPPEKISGIERGEAWQLRKAGKIGPDAKAWAEAMLKIRGLEGIRVLQGLINLPQNYSATQINKGCKYALNSECFRLREVKEFIKQTKVQQNFEFLDEHHLIRDISSYGAFAPDVFNRQIRQNGDVL